ncbi:MAG: iron ABC transporter permease [Eubacteriales bacterium]|nr:iron ABC transporter permease [Eubacteriales bacterium]
MEKLSLKQHILFFSLLTACFFVCLCIGSVPIALSESVDILYKALMGVEQSSTSASILIFVRLPRVTSTGLVGASLAISGAAMQGLLQNPLADGGTLGTSAGAALGAVLSIAFDITLPSFALAGTAIMAILFSFISLIIVMSIAYAVDKNFTNNTIILMGVIFSMFAGSLISLVMAFSGEKLRSITFWTMGSLAGADFSNIVLLLLSLIPSSLVLMLNAREINAFSLGENEALHIGVNVKKVKIALLIAVSCLIGTAVSVGGSIGFVGLIVPHALRIKFSGNYKKLLPLCLYAGAIFLMLTDLLARTILSPVELPIGVVTSFVGAIVFVVIYAGRKRNA